MLTTATTRRPAVVEPSVHPQAQRDVSYAPAVERPQPELLGASKKHPLVYLIVWSGTDQDASRFVQSHYQYAEVVRLSERALRERGWKGQLKELRNLKGHALLFFFESLDDASSIRRLLVLSGLVHRCRETVIADSRGRYEAYSGRHLLLQIPTIGLCVVADLFVLVFAWLFLRIALIVARMSPPSRTAKGYDFDLAYLVPFPLDRTVEGGSMSHLRGFVTGLAKNNARCEIFSGRELLGLPFESQSIPARRSYFLFWESLMLSYNFRFAYQVRRKLGNKRPKAFYQRHRRFVFAGVLLSWWTGTPFILEFNSSEKWTAKHWDPARFVPWLGLAEDLALAAASVIIVVSEALRTELVDRGVPENKILVNPNGVDPTRFKPNSGGMQLRSALGIGNDEVVVSFAGSFSYWHGVEILEKAIASILDGEAEGTKIRFVLVGTGPLAAEMQRRLKSEISSGCVIFTGLIPQDEVIRYLDASDILVSPHVPLPDGRPFFGSPTKLFEYMAMAKAIIASNLDQLASVIVDNETGMLVPPGDALALAKAIVALAGTPLLRERLGQNARAAAQRDHTWSNNAHNVLLRL